MTTHTDRFRAFTDRCLFIDLEVHKKDERVLKIGATRGDGAGELLFEASQLDIGLDRLDELAEGIDLVVGHNFLLFDRPYLQELRPSLRVLTRPVIDTLWLNPLAHPRRPYHWLVKHYKTGDLVRGHKNNPLLDAQLTLHVLKEQFEAFGREIAPELLPAWHWLCSQQPDHAGFESYFSCLRNTHRPTDDEALEVLQRFLNGKGCATQLNALLDDLPRQGWPVAFAIAWISVAGGQSVMPPWVRHQFKYASTWVHRFRNIACNEPDCTWCRTRHDAQTELKRWSGFDTFRPEPSDEKKVPFQKKIIEASMMERPVLGILPTGTGKSLCYQVPALSRYDKTGGLTVVISPLVALMEDQVKGLQKKGIDTCAALNGLLSYPERTEVLDRIRLGEVSIIIVAPEQLRSPSFRDALEQREIAGWVLDEAHCLSKWGHDFRPDYWYVGRFIKEHAEDGVVPPVMCLTATAKPSVIDEITHHFRTKVGIELTVFDGGAHRDKLSFKVLKTEPRHKFTDIAQLVRDTLPTDEKDGAIVYCATRRRTEELALHLKDKGFAAGAFHGGLKPEEKKDIQQSFIDGGLRVIAATNAFGMGIDKDDVRLVVHADIPGSLENYLQEAGRAGRDGEDAQCVLYYCEKDVERQFGLSARSRLERKEIGGILKALRRIDGRARSKQSKREGIVATSGEILLEDTDHDFIRDSATDDTRVRTALSWLEESDLLTREENRTQVFPSSLITTDLAQATKIIKRRIESPFRQRALIQIVTALFQADIDQGITTDELAGRSSLTSTGVRHALHNLEAMGIATNDTALTAYVHVGVENASRRRFEAARDMEKTLLKHFRELAPDLSKGDSTTLNLRLATHYLHENDFPQALQDTVSRLIRGVAKDGRYEDGGRGSLETRALDKDHLRVTLLRDYDTIEATAQLRRDAASRLLDFLIGKVPGKTKGIDLLVSTTHGDLRNVLAEDMILRSQAKDLVKLMEHALLWLHRQDIIRLNRGLTVFRPAMTLRLGSERKRFLRKDFRPLEIHYEEQVTQIHVMAEYARRGLENIHEAETLAKEYFEKEQPEFLETWLPGRQAELKRQTTAESWARIVESLNDNQRRIVCDERNRNLLVLAGPGSGKTKVLVHRIAYLVRVLRTPARSIIALAYNRHAARLIRERLVDLIGEDTPFVTVMTCHALAMRLAGIHFSGLETRETGSMFDEVMDKATALLKGEGLAPEDADAQRDRLLGGFRWILVDEYQDINEKQYALISALAGRKNDDKDQKLNLFAVGDDDQNVYAFSGASVEYLRRFETDYRAGSGYLVENYRSSQHIIDAAQTIIESARDRMKADRPIHIDVHRQHKPLGGRMTRYDPITRGQVQRLLTEADRTRHAAAVMQEWMRLSECDPKWAWDQCAVIAREWAHLEPVASWCKLHSVPFERADSGHIPFFRLRETLALLRHLEDRKDPTVDTEILEAWLKDQPTNNPWIKWLKEATQDFGQEFSKRTLPIADFREWLVDWSRTLRRNQTGLLLLTAHRAKGLEFDHVAIIDGDWDKSNRGEDPDAPTRLLYVAMTRAKETLLIGQRPGRSRLLNRLEGRPSVLTRRATPVDVSDPRWGIRYEVLDPSHVDLSYAGRFGTQHSVHQALRRLEPGAPLWVRPYRDGWALFDAPEASSETHPVGRLAKKYTLPSDQPITARVSAIIERRRADGSPEYDAQLRTDRWETVLAELRIGE